MKTRALWFAVAATITWIACIVGQVYGMPSPRTDALGPFVTFIRHTETVLTLLLPPIATDFAIRALRKKSETANRLKK
jgi:hypothetical protein